MKTQRKKVYVGMSGGVDSSVSALLLKEQGYDVVGIYMKNWSRDLPGMKCPWAEDLADAKRVAVKLGIPFEVWDFEEEYRQKVVDYMLEEFKKGNTPNPDIMCNQEIKFKLFYEKAMATGADFIATGHYARAMTISRPSSLAPVVTGLASSIAPVVANGLETAIALARAVDENKDQTYFLYRISDEALAHTIFPIGEMLKPDVKKLAKEKGLHNAYKKESMGVCFVGEVGMKDFLKEYIEIEPGEIREIETDKVLGYHEGAVFYTIGQRHGLYLEGEKGVVNEGLPYYVVKKDIKKNIIYVSRNLNHEAIWTKELILKNVIMRTEPVFSEAGLKKSETSYTGRPGEPSATQTNLSASSGIYVSDFSNHFTLQKKQVSVRLRHRAPLVPATFDGKTLHFESEVKRPAAGQSAVLYDGEICLGGGIIAE